MRAHPSNLTWMRKVSPFDQTKYRDLISLP